jgi:membrane-bound metal-dependent hydrolase YbcI (DUF457 family)
LPLTPAHAAAAWPLSRLLPRLPLEALVLGTLVPDFQYFMYLAPRGRFSHSLLGLIVFCLPIGLLACFAYTRWARRVIVSMLPGGLRSQVVGSNPRVLLLTAAILVGAASHSAWDSFTHGSGWAVRHLPSLSAPVRVTTRVDVPSFKVLQHGSTVIGLIVVFVWGVGWLRQQPVTARTYSSTEWRQARQTAAIILSASAAGAVANGLRAIGRGPGPVLGYAAVGGMAALIVSLIVVGWFWRDGRRPEPAT